MGQGIKLLAFELSEIVFLFSLHRMSHFFFHSNVGKGCELGMITSFLGLVSLIFLFSLVLSRINEKNKRKKEKKTLTEKKE